MVANDPYAVYAIYIHAFIGITLAQQAVAILVYIQGNNSVYDH